MNEDKTVKRIAVLGDGHRSAAQVATILGMMSASSLMPESLFSGLGTRKPSNTTNRPLNNEVPAGKFQTETRQQRRARERQEVKKLSKHSS